MRIPRLSRYDFERSLQKIYEWLNPRSSVDDSYENLNIVSPVMFPTYSNSFLSYINDILIRRAVFNKINKLQYDSPILVTTIPIIADLLGTLREKISIYYCVDEFSEWHGMNKETIKNMEEKLLRKVDLVIATSVELQQRKSHGKKNVHYLPHGVDFDHFFMCRDIHNSYRDKLHRDDKHLTKIKRPCIGYFGLFDERIDQDILISIAESIDCSILVVGKVDTSISQLSRHENIIFHGPVSYDSLPSVIKTMDILILPYKINQLTVNINPLKMLEYIATGKPIYCSPLPEAKKHGGIINICDGNMQFIDKIRSNIKKIEYKKFGEVFQYLKDETWDKRAETFSKMIQDALI